MSEKPPGAGKLWGGRFRSGIDPDIHSFTTSLPFDRCLVRHDLVGSLAHARMLWECGILDRAAAAAVLGGLSGLLAQVESGELVVEGDDEDIHSWIERLLTERIGDPARRLHTARSRNDQTVTALRLFVRESLQSLGRDLTRLAEVWVEQAQEHLETWMPGYTHLQRGQPTTLAHHLLAHYWSLLADFARLRDVYERAGTNVLGAGALAGSPHPIDPRRSTELLGFARTFANSMHAVADRDWVVESAFVCALVMVHLSRWAEEIILWSSGEFGFASLSDSIAKGSSLMPQKKNPEPAELVRGKAGRVIGDLTALLVVCKGLPLTYNSDLQEDKEAVFDAMRTAQRTLQAAVPLARGLAFDRRRMAAALRGGFLTATDLADHLVKRGVAFRLAHEATGLTVQYAEEQGKELWELSLDEIRRHCPRAGADVFDELSPEASIRARVSHGGPAPPQVEAQLVDAGAELDQARRWLDSQEPPPIYRAHREGRLLKEI